MKIGHYVREERIKKKLRQEDLAEKVNISPTSLSFLEKYHRMPKFDLACRICDVLDIDIKNLWENIKYELSEEELIEKNKA